jgi:hypothetical protein
MTTPQQPGVYNAGVGYPVNEVKDGNLTLVDVYGTGQYGILTAARLNVPGISLAPSADTTGATDTARIQAALNLTGVVTLDTASGPFYIGTAGSPLPGLTVPSPGGYLGGNGGGAHQVYYLGTGNAIYMHGGNNPYPQNQLGGRIENLIVDGTLAGTGAVGIDFGDGDNLTLRNVRVANFTSAGAIGIREVNRFGYTEKSRVWVQLFNNNIGYTFNDNGGGTTHSHWYSTHDLHFNAYAGQNGVQFIGGSGIRNAQEFRIRGNFNTTTPSGAGGPAGTGIVLDFSQGGGSGHIDSSDVHIGCEIDFAGNWGWQTIKFGPLINGTGMLNNTGKIIFSNGPSNFQTSDVVQGQFSFAGSIGGEPALAANNNPPAGWYPGANSAFATPGNPGTINTTTNEMFGLAKTYTPTGSGKVLVICSGIVFTATAVAACTLGARFGTGSAPAYQAADTGTRWGATGDQSLRAAGSANGIGFCFNQVLNLTPGTTYWFDLAGATSNVSNALTVQNLGFSFAELPA